MLKAIHRRDNAIQPGFRVFADGSGHWRALKDDNMVAGTFFTREAALRFARDEASCSLPPRPGAALALIKRAS